MLLMIKLYKLLIYVDKKKFFMSFHVLEKN